MKGLSYFDWVDWFLEEQKDQVCYPSITLKVYLHYLQRILIYALLCDVTYLFNYPDEQEHIAIGVTMTNDQLLIMG